MSPPLHNGWNAASIPHCPDQACPDSTLSVTIRMTHPPFFPKLVENHISPKPSWAHSSSLTGHGPRLPAHARLPAPQLRLPPERPLFRRHFCARNFALAELRGDDGRSAEALGRRGIDEGLVQLRDDPHQLPLDEPLGSIQPDVDHLRLFLQHAPRPPHTVFA